MARVVVTGAAGFLGRVLMLCLEKNGHDVVPVSRRPVLGMHQVQEYSNSPSGDVLIHLAEESDREKVNRLGPSYVKYASDVVRKLVRRSYQKIIYASSGVVYGDENCTPYGVVMPVCPADTYSECKIINEQTVLEKGGGVARLSNLYGNGMANNNIISDIVCQVPSREPLRVRDDRPVRDFLAVADAAAAFGLMVESHCRGIVNVGSGVGTSVRALAEIVLALAGQSSREIVATAPSQRCSVNILDISATTEKLEWFPAISLREYLKCLVNERMQKPHG